MKRWFWATVVLLVGAGPALARDQVCLDEASNEYAEKVRRIKADMIQIEADYKKQLINCGSEPTCMRKAREERARALVKPKQAMVQAKADHDKDRLGCSTAHGRAMPPLRGSFDHGGYKVYIVTEDGRRVGSGFVGPVDVSSVPPRYRKGEGFLLSPRKFRLTKLGEFEDAMSLIPKLVQGISVPMEAAARPTPDSPRRP